jgi:hypothetical protein
MDSPRKANGASTQVEFSILGEIPMHSKDIEKVIADLNKFLRFRHPSSVLQFITSAMVGWTHFDKKNPPSKIEIDLAWHNYLTLLRSSIDSKLSLISSQPHSNLRKRVFKIPSHVFEKKKLDEVIALLGSLPQDESINFMVKVTVNWCFSIPVNLLPLVPVTFPDESDEAIANEIYAWLFRYCDLWS